MIRGCVPCQSVNMEDEIQVLDVQIRQSAGMTIDQQARELNEALAEVIRLQDVDDRHFDGSQHFNPPNPMHEVSRDQRQPEPQDSTENNRGREIHRDDQDERDKRGVKSRDRDRDGRRGRSRDRERVRPRSRSPVRNRASATTMAGRRAVPERAKRCQIHVSNVPFEVKWQELKDAFKEQIGGVRFCDLFTDENGKSRGAGIVEFESPEFVETAIRKMHRFQVRDRKIVVRREAHDRDDDGSGGRDDRGQQRRRSPPRGRRSDSFNDDRGRGRPSRFDNTHGLSEEFLRQLGVEPPLINRVYVTNLVYHVEHRKLYETFKLAGKIRWLALIRDKNAKSRGKAVVEYDHPLEAVQAISLFHNQLYHDRKITVQLDSDDAIARNLKLPPGLERIGKGLGANGSPLVDVALNFRELEEARKKEQGVPEMPAIPMAGAGAANPGYGVPTGPMGNQQGMGANSLTSTSAVQALNALQSLLQTMPRLANVGGAGGSQAALGPDVGGSGAMGGPGSSADHREKQLMNQGGSTRYGNQGVSQPSWPGSYYDP